MKPNHYQPIKPDMKKLITLVFAFAALFANAQFSTPGTGVVWNLDSLVNNSGGVVTWNNDHYEILSTVTIMAEDQLDILGDVTVVFHDLAGIESSGTLIIDAPDQSYFTAIDSTSANKWRGIRLLPDHVTHIKNATFSFGGGIRVQSGTFTIDGCTFYKNFYKSGSTAGSYASSAALDVLGRVSITNCKFLHNQRGAIGSGANIACRAYIRNNYMFGNTTENSNRPQINMGPSGANDTTFIIGNTIIGNGFIMSGGIAYSSLIGVAGNVVIDSNFVDKNRYGITLTGSPINGAIRYNVITDNDIQNLPNLGGSGINLTASGASAIQNVTVTGNEISGNLWGITIVGYPKVNMGNSDPENFNPGGNVFSNNGNGGVLYDLYNNGPVEQYAMYNCWGVAAQDSASIEGVVVHKVDDPALGRVHFMPSCAYETYFTARNEAGDLLEGVQISVAGVDGTFTTDATGTAFGMVPPGGNTFTATLSGYSDYNGSFTVVPGINQVEFVMLPPVYQLSFFVYDQDIAPIAGAEIEVASQLLVTNATGQASTALPNGIYPYTVTKEGYYPAGGNAIIADGNTEVSVQLTSTVEPKYTLTFVVSDPEANPLAGVSIEVEGVAGALVTDDEGTAMVELPNGTYDYTATLDGYESASGSVAISGSNVEEEITMQPVAPPVYTLTFVVSAEAGVVEGVEIAINSTVLVTNAEGIATIELPDGTYAYTATKAGFDVIEGEVVIDGADVEELVFLTTGVDPNLLTGLKIYPNPAKDYLLIEGAQSAEAEIYTLNGKLVLRSMIRDGIVNISPLEAGTYVIRLVSGRNSSVQTFVKH